MKCPVCIEEGQKSTVRDRGGMTTLMACQPFYDEEGRHHHHDRNTTTSDYSCSRGHSFAVSKQGSCWCGWNKDQVPHVQVAADRVITDPEVLKAMTSAPSEFSISGTKHGCGE